MRFVRRHPRLLRRWSRIARDQPHTLLFYPQHPRDKPYDYTISRLCRVLGVRMSTATKARHTCAINWQDRPVGAWDEQLAALEEHPGLINARCRDIRKQRVAETFAEAFRYGLAVDPLTHEGPCVEKSDSNGRHDGVIRQCPIPAATPGKTYEKLIDNAAPGPFVYDYRLPIFRHEIPLVFIKYKPVADRFGVSVKAELTSAEAVFSTEERQRILRFCELLGIDYGELDVLRDQRDRRIYIVDANNTPTAHYVGFDRSQKRFIIETLAAAFDRMFLCRIRA